MKFYEAYFSSTDIPFYVVQGTRRVLEQELMTDLSRAIPTDSFYGNLKFLLDELQEPDTLVAIEDEFGIKITDEEASQMQPPTVAKIIEGVWRSVERHNEKTGLSGSHRPFPSC